MSNGTESRTVAFWTMFFNGQKVNFTIRGGTPLDQVAEDLVVLRDTMSSLDTFGFSLVMKDEDGSEWDEVRSGLHWVRGVSYKGKPCMFVYSDTEGFEDKVLTVYKNLIPDLPVTQAEWDSAKVYNGQGTSPKKSDAYRDGYLHTFPQEMSFGGTDRGDGALFNGNRTYWWDKVLNPRPGGVSFGGPRGGRGEQDDMDQTGGRPPASAPVGTGKVINDTGTTCQCGAPAGKPHATSCPIRIAVLTGGAVQQGTTGSKTPRTFGKKEEPHKASPRQALTAQLMMIGRALYEDQWDTIRQNAVIDYGVQSGSAADLTEAQLEEMIDALKDTMIEGLFDCAGNAGWTEDKVTTLLNAWDFHGLSDWDGDPVSLPVTFIVRLYEEAAKDATAA